MWVLCPNLGENVKAGGGQRWQVRRRNQTSPLRSCLLVAVERSREKSPSTLGSDYCMDRQARGFLFTEVSAPPPDLEHDYGQYGFGEKRGRVRLSRLSSYTMGEHHGARVRQRNSAEFSERASECGSQDSEKESRQRVRQRA